MNDTESASRTSDVGALVASLVAARDEAHRRHAAETAEIAAEVQRLEAAVAELQAQLTSLAEFQAEAAGRHEAGLTEAAHAARDQLIAALHAQRESLTARAAAWADGESAREQRIAAAFESSPHAAAFREWRAVRPGEGALAGLPASYRAAVEAHHAAQGAALREALASLVPGPQPLSEAPLHVDVIVTVDEEDGEPTLASLLLPVPDAVASQWAARGDDLFLALAATVVAGVHRATAALGLSAARPAIGGHDGLLAIEVEFPGAAAQAVATECIAALEAAGADSVILGAARLHLTARRVPADFLLPPTPATASAA